LKNHRVLTFTVLVCQQIFLLSLYKKKNQLAFRPESKMGVTRVDILTPVDLAQVFLWLQEKSLMGQYNHV
jgi:hypothetical protein